MFLRNTCTMHHITVVYVLNRTKHNSPTHLPFTIRIRLSVGDL